MFNLSIKFVFFYSIFIHIASFLCFSAVSGDFPSVAAAAKFDFATLTLSSLKLLGDAHLNNGSVRLTRDLAVPTSSAGRALYAKPIRFRRPGNHSPVSFSTYFSFSITNLNPSSIGGGLAFVITPDDDFIGTAGGFLGLTDGSGSGFVAVEFDTLMDVAFKDVNGNHVGLDLNDVVSTAVADLSNVDIDLKSGDAVNTWITYDGSGRILAVYVSYSNVKPKTPILSVPLDLDRFVNDFMFVGFSGSTQGSTEIHSIEWWSFSSSFGSEIDQSVSPPPISPSAISPPPSLAPSVSTTRQRSTTPPSSCRNQLCKKSPAAVAGVVTAGAFFLAVFAGVLIWVYSKKIRYSQKSESFVSGIIKTPREFSYKDLKSATDSFSSSRIIGNGAFGIVYRGVLQDSGDIVAVKRCSHASQGNTEFLSELSIIGTLRHRNLLRLLGYCREKGEILLVYDLMPNGSLDKALFESPMPLPWPDRRKILLGVASALAYLHQECENQIIHRDVKTSNIMLDESFNPKLGDFGLARQTEHDKSPDATAAAGTMGYLAPEYLLTGRATEKTDVFSYGAVVLEVSTGRRPIPRNNTPGPKPGHESGFGSKSSLVDWVWGLYRDGKLLTAADERLHGGYNEVEMGRVLMLGLACSHPDPTARPTMRGVVQILIGEADVPAIPTAKPSMSFSTSELLLTLQDSVSDCNEALVPVSTSGSSSENDNFIVGNDRSV